MCRNLCRMHFPTGYLSDSRTPFHCTYNFVNNRIPDYVPVTVVCLEFNKNKERTAFAERGWTFERSLQLRPRLPVNVMDLSSSSTGLSFSFCCHSKIQHRDSHRISDLVFGVISYASSPQTRSIFYTQICCRTSLQTRCSISI